MIKPTELRIGNSVSFKDIKGVTIYGTIISLGTKNANIDFAGGMPYCIAPYGRIDPIPLTPELLEACGFELLYKGGAFMPAVMNKHFKEAGMLIEVYADKEGKGWHFGNWFPDKIGVEYLHTMQNIIYLLTGEELTVKLPATP
jgi:hypothetical protein